MNYTSVEQSKELLKLGLNPESADMYWVSFISRGTYPSGKDFEIIEPFELSPKPVEIGYSCKECIPCWNVGGLMDVISSSIRSISTVCMPVIYFHNKRIVYKIGWGTLHVSNGESFLESCYDMVEWLLKEKKI